MGLVHFNVNLLKCFGTHRTWILNPHSYCDKIRPHWAATVEEFFLMADRFMVRINRVWELLLLKMERFDGFRAYMVALLVVMFLAYDSQVWRMGFYYDDWEGVFLYKQNFSNLQIWQYFLIDRPMSSVVHFIFNPIFGSSSIGWHILALLLNWGAILLFVKMLLRIWPKHVMVIGWIGLLIGIYPGISRQFVVRTSIPHYTSMFLFMLSLYLMVYSFQNKKRRKLWVFVSVLLGCLQTLLIEYFAGLELIRILILFYLVRRDENDLWPSFRRTILLWLPYASIFLVFLVYKFSVLPLIQLEGEKPKHAVKFITQFSRDPIETLYQYANLVVQDIVFASLYAWTFAVNPANIDLHSRAMIFSWITGIIIAIFSSLVIESWVRKTRDPGRKIPFPGLIIFMAIIAIFFGGLPSWLIGRQAAQGTWSSRFLFGQVFGVVSLVVLFIYWLVGSERRIMQHIALAVLLASSFSLQFQTGNKYARDWDYQRNYFWQLKWRIPALQPKAFIVSPKSALALTVDYQMAFAINILFSPGNNSTDSQHWWFNAPEELRSYIAGEIDSKRKVKNTFRTISFESDMLHAIPVLNVPARGCLLVVDPVYESVPGLLSNELPMFTTTHPEMILLEGPPMPVDVFGKEPPRTWCYYFQKADLGRQYQQWENIVTLWAQAESLGYSPSYGPEYLPFIEAFAHKGDWKMSKKLTEKAAARTKDMFPFLCENWRRIISETDSSVSRDQAWQVLQTVMACEN